MELLRSEGLSKSLIRVSAYLFNIHDHVKLSMFYTLSRLGWGVADLSVIQKNNHSHTDDTCGNCRLSHVWRWWEMEYSIW